MALEPARQGFRDGTVKRLRDLPAIAACVSLSPPNGTAPWIASSTSSAARNAISALGTEPWQVTSMRYDGRMWSSERRLSPRNGGPS